MVNQQMHPLDALNNVISDICGNIDQYKKNPSDFTRNRKLPVDQLIKTTLNMQGQSLEAELLKAYPDMDDRMTKSAYEQQKAKLKPEIFEDIFHQYNDTLENPKTLDIVNSYAHKNEHPLSDSPWQHLGKGVFYMITALAVPDT